MRLSPPPSPIIGYIHNDDTSLITTTYVMLGCLLAGSVTAICVMGIYYNIRNRFKVIESVQNDKNEQCDIEKCKSQDDENDNTKTTKTTKTINDKIDIIID